MNIIKNSLRQRILSTRKSFNPYIYHNENELILEKIKTVVNSIYSSPSLSKKIVNLVSSQVEVLPLDCGVGIYLPLKGEPDLTKLVISTNWVISLPKLENFEIKFVYYKLGDKLEKNEIGTLEPASYSILKPNIVIVPALAYSIEGYRLGFGKGYYDKYFSANKEHRLIKIGVCFDEFLLEKLPAEKHDVKFDYIITEKNILKL